MENNVTSQLATINTVENNIELIEGASVPSVITVPYVGEIHLTVTGEETNEDYIAAIIDAAATYKVEQWGKGGSDEELADHIWGAVAEARSKLGAQCFFELEPVLTAIEDAARNRFMEKWFMTISDAALLDSDIAPPEYIINPILRKQGLMMVHAPRGLGKTYFCMTLAVAAAYGRDIFRWECPEKRKVLYVDGEMPLYDLKERLRSIVQMFDIEDDGGNLVFISPDQQGDRIPDLASSQDQKIMEWYAKDMDLVIIDNISTLYSGSENEAEAWSNMQRWLLRLRRLGKSVILVHHSGKGGLQRGSSRREDALNTVIGLRKPEDYREEDGARFEVHFEKHRGLAGADARPFEAALVMSHLGAEMEWSVGDVSRREKAEDSWAKGGRPQIADEEVRKAEKLLEDGYSQRQVVEMTGRSKGWVSNVAKSLSSALAHDAEMGK